MTSSSRTPTPESSVTGAQVRELAKEAYIYGFPMVDSCRIEHAYFVDEQDSEYKGPWNHIHSTARVYTPADTAIQTPNSDTPYSMLGADLRAEPLVLTIPPIEPGRYYSVQFIDGYTYDFDYLGSRATGNGGGTYLLAGPRWHSDTPAGIDGVIHAETDVVLAIYRTQLFGPDDIDDVKNIQAGYQVQPLSAFLGELAPAALPPWTSPRRSHPISRRPICFSSPCSTRHCATPPRSPPSKTCAHGSRPSASDPTAASTPKP